MTRMPVSGARSALAEALNRVAYGRERIVLQRRGKDVAALIPVDDLHLFEKLLAEAEDRLDVEEARRRLADETDMVSPYDEARKRVGLPRAVGAGRPARKPR